MLSDQFVGDDRLLLSKSIKKRVMIPKRLHLRFRVIDEVALPIASSLMYGAMVFDIHGSNTDSSRKGWLLALAIIGACLTLPLWLGLRKHYAYTASKLTLTDESLLVRYGRGVISLPRAKLRILEGSDRTSTWRLKDGVHNLPLDCEHTFTGPDNVTVSGLQIARRLEKWSGRSIEQWVPQD